MVSTDIGKASWPSSLIWPCSYYWVTPHTNSPLEAHTVSDWNSGSCAQPHKDALSEHSGADEELFQLDLFHGTMSSGASRVSAPTDRISPIFCGKMFKGCSHSLHRLHVYRLAQDRVLKSFFHQSCFTLASQGVAGSPVACEPWLVSRGLHWPDAHFTYCFVCSRFQD